MQKEPPLVPRSRRVEVFERLNEHCEVLISFDEMSLKAAIEQMQAAKVEAVAIYLLFSFANPDADLAWKDFRLSTLRSNVLSIYATWGNPTNSSYRSQVESQKQLQRFMQPMSAGLATTIRKSEFKLLMYD